MERYQWVEGRGRDGTLEGGLVQKRKVRHVK
jgi:hypothetical protein